MRHTLILAITLLAITTVSAAGGQDGDWMPERVASGLTMQLVERLETIGGKRAADRAALIAETRARIETLRAIVGGWNVAGVISRAPDLKRLSLPSALDPHVEAMMRYQICNVVLTLQYEGGRTPDGRRMGAMGLTALTTVQARLLEPFVARGGKTSAVEAALTGSRMATVIDQIQRDPETLAYVQNACGPVLDALLDPIR